MARKRQTACAAHMSSQYNRMVVMIILSDVCINAKSLVVYKISYRRALAWSLGRVRAREQRYLAYNAKSLVERSVVNASGPNQSLRLWFVLRFRFCRGKIFSMVSFSEIDIKNSEVWIKLVLTEKQEKLHMVNLHLQNGEVLVA